MSDLEPITRKEQYLNRLTGEEQTIPEEPITRTEQYLARLCGMETEIPSSPITREETYLAYLNGEDVTLPEPITRLEQFMAYAASKSETKPTPLTREEFYWDKYQGGAVLKDFPGLPASVVTVTDALAKPLDSLKVAITPVQSGSGDPSPDNIRPISGWTECNVTRCGVNLFDINKVYPSIKVDDRTITVTGGAYYRDIYTGRSSGSQKIYPSDLPKMPMLSTGNYVLKYDSPDDGYLTLHRVYKNCTSASVRLDDGKFTIQTSGRITLRRVANSVRTFSDIMIIKTDEAPSEYIPYTGQDYSIPFVDGTDPLTVYGGTLDVTNGTLTVTKANIASYDGETLPGVWISDRDVYAEGATPTTGAQVVYDLATPITYQLTPTEITMLLGTNNIWADTGNILEGKYYGKRSSSTRQMLNTVRDAGEITEITPEEPEENDER